MMKEPYRSQFIKTKHLIDFHQKEIEILEGQLEDISYNNTIDGYKQLKQKQLYIDNFEIPINVITEGIINADKIVIKNLGSDLEIKDEEIRLVAEDIILEEEVNKYVKNN